MDILPVIAVTLLAGVEPATAPVGTSPVSVRPGPTVTTEQFDQMIADLQHPRFAVREAATERLCNLDARYLPMLAGRYRARGDYETKRRIRYAVEYIFHRKQIVGREGFLGVSILQSALPELTDPTTGRATFGVVVNDVKTGFSAERAGMQDGDVIIAVDGRPMPHDPTSASFVKMVSSCPPGSRIDLRVLRAERDPREVTAQVPEPPAKVLEGATLERLPQAPGFSLRGTRVVRVAPGSQASALGLKPNDIITPSKPQPTPGIKGRPRPQDVFETSKPGPALTLRVLSFTKISLRVTLGARPPEFMDNADDLAAARARFARWWHEQGGELTVPARKLQKWNNLVRTEPPRPPGSETSVLP